ncbi:uncharacterized protein BXZ73DRAFT_40221 [Epithele typhae]|uniref:uncharacterized protein n=1 Tax=Epithele typhae TaxID=378194 RepID=UPI002007867B|nr:uncharacterized protein BXZ73DRAFT_40221 [Epithele typhae]KAH9943241.1 hypothetical protein BXZ73DRAFT_40221 [Epithele typhae]
MNPRPPSPHGPSKASAHDTPNYNPSISATQDRKAKHSRMMGITAGAEDVKYHAKYRELKKKVKEIESDNDKLYFKLLLAKKNIRRMNLERAILYERLAAVPPTPGRQTQELPSDADPIFQTKAPAPPEHARVIKANDRDVSEYLRARPNARLVEGPDGRVVAIEDTPASTTVDARGVPIPAGPPPPHGIPLVQSFQHDSGPGYDPSRQLPPPPPMIPLLQHNQEPAGQESSVTSEHHANQYPYPQSRPPPPPHASHSHSNSTHRSRSSSARPDLDSVPGGTSRMEGPPPSSYSVHSRSPNMPGEPPMEHRSRRHDIHEHAQPHGHPHPRPPIHVPQQGIPESPPILSPTSHHRRGPHNHQRIGPGANIHREVDPERDYERRQQLEYERSIERERDLQRAVELKHRLEMEEREEQALWAEQEARARVSRSGSPGSVARAGGSRESPLPAPSGHAHDHDRERGPRGYAPHLMDRDADERNGLRDRGAGREGSSGESRKRARDEMEVDDRYEGAASEGGASARSAANGRGGKRPHSEEEGDGSHAGSGNGEGVVDDRMEEA